MDKKAQRRLSASTGLPPIAPTSSTATTTATSSTPIIVPVILPTGATEKPATAPQVINVTVASGSPPNPAPGNQKLKQAQKGAGQATDVGQKKKGKQQQQQQPQQHAESGSDGEKQTASKRKQSVSGQQQQQGGVGGGGAAKESSGAGSASSGATPSGNAALKASKPTQYDDPKQRQKAQKKQILALELSSKQVPLFAHLPQYERPKVSVTERLMVSAATNAASPHANMHPKIIRLGLKYVNRQLQGSNARTLGMLKAFKHFIRDHEVRSVPPPLCAAEPRELWLAAEPFLGSHQKSRSSWF